jgi:DNA-binding MurR/RpiR family transcriptional regulator
VKWNFFHSGTTVRSSNDHLVTRRSLMTASTFGHMTELTRSEAVDPTVRAQPGSPSAEGEPGILEVLRSSLQSLSPAERKVADYVLSDPLAVVNMSVTQLAEASQSSVGTVVRCCKSLRLRGYQDLKLSLARQASTSEQYLLDEIRPGDGPAEVTAKVLNESAAALTGAVQAIDTAALGRIASTLLAASRILFVAVGTSAPLASDVSYRLSGIGLPAFFLPDVHTQHMAARMLTPGDACVAISHTGSTVETLAAVRAASEAGAATVALTSFQRSPLTELVSQLLVAGSRETTYRIEAMASRIVHLAVLDALYVVIALRHPGAHDAQDIAASILSEHRI